VNDFYRFYVPAPSKKDFLTEKISDFDAKIFFEVPGT
jgi:hypothetical protein